MDFMQLLRSLQEMLYEVMSWLVFYPRTLWRVVRDPVGMTKVSEAELAEPPQEQYTDTVSPPLFLLLSILLAHGLEQMLNARLPELDDGGLLVQIAATPQNLLIYRAITFALLPLIAAVEYLTRQKHTLDRTTLKRPFYSHCYLAGPFVLAFIGASAAASVADQRGVVGFTILGLAALLWYAAAIIAWYRRALATSWPRATLVGTKVILLAFLTNATLSTLLSLGSPG